MLRFDVLQNLWVWAALVGGVAFVLVAALTYAVFQRPPAPEEKGRIPWVLILTYVFLGIFALAFTLAMAFHPPNW